MERARRRDRSSDHERVYAMTEAGTMASDQISGASDQNPGEEDEGAAYDDLKCGGEEGSVHVTVADPGDRQQPDGDDEGRNRCGGGGVGGEKGKRMTHAAQEGHEAADGSAQQRPPP